MSKGIYGYWDNQKEYVAYIGQTGDLEHRKRQHTWQSSDKKIDKILINNPNRYEYFVLAEGEFTDTELDEMKVQAIAIFKTNKYKNPDKSVFNFTDGGGGMRGYKFSQETKTKMSKAASKRTGEKNSFYGHKHTEEWKQKYWYGENNPMYGKTGEKHHNYRGDVPSPKDLLNEYETTNVTYKKLAEKYSCSENTINRRLKKARGEINEWRE